MSSRQTKRLEFIDCAKGIGIILVVIAHHLQEAENVIWWINSFHMPLFFLISGYLYEYQNKIVRIKELIISGIKSFLWPYFTFNTIIIFWWIMLSLIFHVQPEENLCNIVIRFLSTYGYHALWFLPTMFIVSTVSKFYKNNNRWLILALSILLGCTISYVIYSSSIIKGFLRYVLMYLGRCMLGISFVEIGRIIYKLNNEISFKIEWLILICSFLISLVLHKENILVSMVFCRIGNPILYYLNSIAGSIIILIIAKKICISYLGRSLCFWGKNSLITMCLHMDISIELAWLVVGFMKLYKVFSFKVTSIVVIIIELIFLYLIIKFINRYALFLVSVSFRKRDE